MPIGGHDANTGTAGTVLADTDALAEGSSNLYFTNARVDTQHQAINTQGTYANRPAAGAANTGYLYCATDIGVTFRSTGTAWTVIADLWGFDFFSTLGYLPADVTVSSLPAHTIPAADATILVASGSFNRTENLADFTWGATTGTQVAAWNFAALKSKVVIVCVGSPGGTGVGLGLMMQNAVLSGADMDNGYLNSLGASGLFLQKESAGYTTLDSDPNIITAAAAANPWFGLAVYYSDAADLLVGFVKGAGGWGELLRAPAETTFTTMKCAGFREGNTTANKKKFITGPFLIFTEA